MYEVSLQITKIGYTSDGETRYLAVNASEAPDAPELALVVNEVSKNLLVYFNRLWNNHSSAILKCVKKHYQAIIRMVHTFSEEASESGEIPSEFAQIKPKSEICDMLWESSDKSQGRAALEHTVDLVFEILGRD